MPEKRPLVSIGMPFYNCDNTLGDAINSILWQTYENWELLLCDDGSMDGSLEVARSFSDERIVLWSDSRNKKLQVRLNECIARARGKYFARMDGDDVAYPTRLEKQVQFLQINPEVDLVGTSVLVFGEEGKPLGVRRGPMSHENICRRPTSGFYIAHPTFCGKLSWFRNHLYDVTALLIEDQELLLRTYEQSEFANIPEILQGYREEHFNPRKTLQGRRLWSRALWCHFSGKGHPASALLAVTAQAFKGAVDWAAVKTHTERLLLRHRARPLRPEETDHWRRICDALNGRNLR